MVKRPGLGDVERVSAEVLRAPIVTADAEHFGANVIEAARGFGVAALDAIRAGVARRQPVEDQGFVAAAVGRGHAEFAETFRARRHEIDDGGAEFLPAFEGDLAGRIDPLIEDVRAGGYRPSAEAITEARGRLASLGVRMSGRAAEIEHAARFGKQVRALDGALVSLRDQAFTEPDLFHVLLDDATEVAEGARAFLPDAEVARRLSDVRHGIPRAALKGLIAQTPALAREALESGAFDDVVAGAAKQALVRDARVAEARAVAMEKARAAEERAAFTADLAARVRRGHAGHADIAEAVEAKALTTAEGTALRDAADHQAELTARVAALIAGEDAEPLDAGDPEHTTAVDSYYVDSILPSLDGLPEDATTGRLIRFVARMGIVPETMVNELRAGILSGVAKNEVTASSRVVVLDGMGSNFAPSLPIAEKVRAHAIAGFAGLGFTPARAVELGTELIDKKERVPAAPRRGDADETGVTDFLYRPRMIVDSDGTLRPETRDEETRRTATPMVERPGFVWENGRWRRETPEEAERSRGVPLGLAAERAHTQASTGDDDEKSGTAQGNDEESGETGRGEGEPNHDVGDGKGRDPDGEHQKALPRPGDFPVPDYRKQAVPQQQMDAFMSHHGAAGSNLRDALKEIFAAEGGLKRDEETGQAYAGITPTTLDGLNERMTRGLIPERPLPVTEGSGKQRKTPDLTPEQAAQAYGANVDDVMRKYGGVEALETLPDKNTAAAMVDAMFLHGSEGGARLVKKAANDVIRGLDQSERERLGIEPLPEKPDPKGTLAAIQKLSGAGLDQTLRDRIANARLKTDVARNSPGVRERIEHFRFRPR